MWSSSITLDQCFLFGEISPNFNLNNMISTYTKDFPWKNVDKKSQDYILNIHTLDFEHVNALLYFCYQKQIPFLINYRV
jgi:hypothetical protein